VGKVATIRVLAVSDDPSIPVAIHGSAEDGRAPDYRGKRGLRLSPAWLVHFRGMEGAKPDLDHHRSDPLGLRKKTSTSGFHGCARS